MPIRDRGPDEIVGICFHGIGAPSAGLEPAAHEYFVSADLFLAVLDEAAGTPGVQLTFDDGYASDVEVALPALAERGLTATFFPLAGMLGRPGYLDAGGVRELSAAGMTVGSHGMRHRSWRGLDAESEARGTHRGPVADRRGCPGPGNDRGLPIRQLRSAGARGIAAPRLRAGVHQRPAAGPGRRLAAAALQHQARRHPGQRPGEDPGAPAGRERVRCAAAARSRPWR